MSIFSKSNAPVNQPNRNKFDLSYQNNITTKFGRITPVFCKEVVPGDTFHIKSTFGLRTMPMYFPIQSKVNAYMHFFYVRNRNLWKDWTDFICKTKENLVPPYIDFTSHAPQTGSLYDYMGLPTTYYKGTKQGGDGTATNTTIEPSKLSTYTIGSKSVNAYFESGGNYLYVFSRPSSSTAAATLLTTNVNDCYSGVYRSSSSGVVTISKKRTGLTKSDFMVFGTFIPFTPDYSAETISGITSNPQSLGIMLQSGTTGSVNDVFTPDQYKAGNAVENTLLVAYDSDGNVFAYNSGSKWTYNDGYSSANLKTASFFIFSYVQQSLSASYSDAYSSAFSCAPLFENDTYDYVVDYDLSLVDSAAYNLTNSINPYYSSTHNTAGIKVSALPYRAYESIYNSYFRNIQVNPLKIDGVAEYNVYNKTTDGGPQSSTDFDFYYRNYETDVYTGSLPSPQQGTAPLVGISSTGEVSFKDIESGKVYTATLNESDGTISSFTVTSDSMPTGNLQQLTQLSTMGIGINDLRNVNALQEWLETNMRRGLAYKDQVLSHFGVNPKYQPYDIPQFIGGAKARLDVNSVAATSQSDNTALGDLGAFGTCFGGDGSINCYCDEHGFIIGVLSIVPVPSYSQTLSKSLMQKDVFEYYFPEFKNTGMQPIFNSEVAPVHSYVEGNKDEVFAYQRPFYEYLSSLDEVHGDFRLTLRDYLLNRVFEGVPQLSQDFIEVKPSELNDIFNYTEDTDKILGAINFEVTAERPMPYIYKASL